MKIWNTVRRVICILGFGVLLNGTVYAKEVSFPEGVYIGDLSLEGMTQEEAELAVRKEIQQKSHCRLTLDVDGTAAETTAEELGFSWKNPEAVKDAAGYVAHGNLIRQYMNRKDLQKEPVHIDLEAGVDQELFSKFVEEKCVALERQPQNASIIRIDGAFQITPGAAGIAVDTEATRAEIDQVFSEAKDDNVTVKAVIVERQPDITADMLSSIGDMLGTFSTDFSSSGGSRAGNLRNGASKINGHVLMPGETLSGYECMHPFTTQNGYFTAAAYENGQVVDSVGGGVCQIATTLYNAALQAELEITQRQNHSMIVTYVKPSMDAAIAGTYKDIKITNNYSTPIYVEGGTSGRTLTFTIYGKETRPANRQVQYISETLGTTDPGAPSVRVDPTMAPGARRQVQSAHIGRRSRLWKVVTVDGVETERTMLHEDTYNPAKAIVLVGPPQVLPPQLLPGAETNPAEQILPQETQPQEIQPESGQNPQPGHSQEPQAQQPSGPAQETQAVQQPSGPAQQPETVPETVQEPQTVMPEPETGQQTGPGAAAPSGPPAETEAAAAGQ